MSGGPAGGSCGIAALAGGGIGAGMVGAISGIAGADVGAWCA